MKKAKKKAGGAGSKGGKGLGVWQHQLAEAYKAFKDKAEGVAEFDNEGDGIDQAIGERKSKQAAGGADGSAKKKKKVKRKEPENTAEGMEEEDGYAGGGDESGGAHKRMASAAQEAPAKRPKAAASGVVGAASGCKVRFPGTIQPPLGRALPFPHLHCTLAVGSSGRGEEQDGGRVKEGNRRQYE